MNRVKAESADVYNMLQTMYNHDFPDAVGGASIGKSVDDLAWRAKVEESICLKDGRYEICLPFRDVSPTMPNNKIQVMRRAEYLARKFSRDNKFKLTISCS